MCYEVNEHSVFFVKKRAWSNFATSIQINFFLMKTKLLITIICLLYFPLSWGYINQTTSRGGSVDVVLSHQYRDRPIRLSEPCVVYYLSNSIITIDFGNQPVEEYSVTISSPFTDVDYYATSSYTTIPLVVDGYSDYTIIIETSDGDIFEGTLAASEYASTQMF